MRAQRKDWPPFTKAIICNGFSQTCSGFVKPYPVVIVTKKEDLHEKIYCFLQAPFQHGASIPQRRTGRNGHSVLLGHHGNFDVPAPALFP